VAEKTVLREISFTAFPADANSAATVAATASFREKTKMAKNFTKWLTAKGFDVEDLSAEQEVTLQAMYDEDIAAANEEGANVPSADEIKAEIRNEAAAEATRIREITKICAAHNNR